MTFWTPGTNLSLDKVAYIRSQDYGTALTQLAVRGTPCPAIVVVQPNAQSVLPIAELILEFSRPAQPQILCSIEDLQQRHASSHRRRVGESALKKIDPVFCDLVRSARDVLVNVQDSNALGVAQAARALESAATILNANGGRCSSRTPLIAAFVSELAVQLLWPCEQATAFAHPDSQDARKAWWNALPTLHGTCSALIRQFDAAFPQPRSTGVAGIRKWLEDLHTQLQLMRQSVGHTHKAIFEQAAAWFAAAADRHMMRLQIGWGMLFLHRAVEWLLLAKCHGAGFVEITAFGARYKEACVARDRTKPTFTESLSLLNNSTTSFHGLGQDFEDLNRWRNLMPYTHHMTVAEDEKGLDLYCRIRGKLEKFAGRDWEIATDVYRRPMPVDLGLLLDPDEIYLKALVVH
jgi:hypothetical protein